MPIQITHHQWHYIALGDYLNVTSKFKIVVYPVSDIGSDITHSFQELLA